MHSYEIDLNDIDFYNVSNITKTESFSIPQHIESPQLQQDIYLQKDIESPQLQQDIELQKDIESPQLQQDIEKSCELSNNQSDYIWEELSQKWQTKLLSSKFFIKNCLGDGNCQFRSIETALINSGYKTNHNKLRNIIVKYINNLDNPTFFKIIQNYRIEKDNGEFLGNWDPYSIRNKRNFTNQIKQDGFHFQGDHTTLSLLSNALNIDFIILTSDFNIINLSNPENNHKLIILYYDKTNNKNGHYKTIGFKIKRKIESIFKAPFPPEIENLLDKNKLLLNHLNDIINETINDSKHLQLNNILMSMQKRLHTNISSEDKNTIMLLLTFWLEDNKYFEKKHLKTSPKKRSLKSSPKKSSLKSSPKKSSPKKSSPKKSSLKKSSPKKSSPKKSSLKKSSPKKSSPKTFY
jgi:hypothetical protein